MSSETVKVMVRCRPMNSSEVQRKCGTCVQVDVAANSITLVSQAPGDVPKVFTYDYVFQQDILQQTVYENSAFPLVESVVEGYNGTIFAYGQTGCGKTHSMLGLPNDEVQKGIIPRSFSHIINIIESTNDKKFLVRCSYIEIYNEEIRDLLGKDVKAKMDLKESPDKGVFVKDLTMVTVKTVAEMEKWMNIGTDNRSVGATKMNSTSSRSHSLFTLYIECSYIPEGQTEEHYTAGKLNLVDLAGSERQSKTEATGERLKEATKINLSLSALGNVISALVDGKSQHVPYRDSKLTRLLQDSLGGNTKTIMLAAVSPADYNFDETLSTLRYASRAKNIKNQPKVNQDPKDAQLKEYADEIKKLKELLMQQQANGGAVAFNINPSGGQANLSNNSNNNGSQNQNGKVQSEKELKQLQEKNEALDAEKRKMEEQMKNKDIQYQEELKEKERIRQMLQELEMKMVVGGTADQDKKKKVSQMRSKLKKQMAEHEKITAEMERKEEDFLFLENKYSSLQEELDATKKICRKLRAKVKQQQGEMKDFQRETEMEKGDLLETIRYQEREVKILQTIALMLLTADEIEIIKSQGEWTDDYMTYKLPPFYFKQKKLNFPKLPVLQAQELINQEKELREVDFQFHSQSLDNRSNHNNNNNNNNQNNYPHKSSTNLNGNSSKGQQVQNGPPIHEYSSHGRHYNQKDYSGLGNDDPRLYANGKQQQSNNRYLNNHNGNGNGNGFKNYKQDDTDSLPDSASIKSISDSLKDVYNQSPVFTNKKNGHKASIPPPPEKARITNVSLDPIDQRISNQKLSGLQDAFEASLNSEQQQPTKISLKNVQLQPISSNIRPMVSQSLGGLNAKQQQHHQSDNLDPLSQKPSNKIKLDKLHVPR